nr:PREDICTED: probable monogalactosyldiacylglycerol synthase 3, chloroplastic [Musa acuminata subsp. malaccensis]
MGVLVESPWLSIREVVIQSVTAYHAQQQQRKRKSLSWSSADGSGGSAVGDDGDIGFWEEEEEGTMELAQIGAERTKNVLILMSDTGGGHRASAEAIRDAFRIEFGDEYRVFVKDLDGR